MRVPARVTVKLRQVKCLSINDAEHIIPQIDLWCLELLGSLEPSDIFGCKRAT
jgi:hypothetical protein